LESFSDGVFAFAATLLVEAIAIHPPGSALEQVLRAWPSYLAYVVSFLTIGAAWLAHTALTDRLARADRILLRLNLFLLLVAVFLPFPTRLVARALHQTGGEREFVTSEQRELLAVVVGYVVAILLGLALPSVAVAVYFALALYLRWPSRGFHRSRSRVHSSSE
jgi:TMEM175 potassium channel family protein